LSAEGGEELQRLILELNLLQSYAENVQRTIEGLAAALSENRIVRSELSEMKESVEPRNVLVPLGPAVFVRAGITDFSRVLLNIGAGIYRDVSVEEALSRLEEYEKNLEKTIANLQSNLAQILRRMQEIQLQVEKLQKKQQ